MSLNKRALGASLVVQWLRPCTSNAEGVVSIPGQETKIPLAPHSQKMKYREGEFCYGKLW